jgi:quercetin dioxygenase-like cupin family protein
MKKIIRQLGTALLWSCLGAGVFWVVSTHTSSLQFLQKRTEFRVVNTNEMSWVEGGKGDPAKYFMKFLYKDVNNGQVAMLVRYPAGQIMPAHLHSHGHGMYVLSGHLVTDRGTYGPGTFVWSPANEVISHGAPPDEDVVVLFLRHEDMDIHFMHPAPH